MKHWKKDREDVLKKFKSLGPMDGHSWLLSLQDLKHFATAIVAYQDIEMDKGSHFVLLSEQKKETYVRQALRLVDLTKERIKES